MEKRKLPYFALLIILVILIGTTNCSRDKTTETAGTSNVEDTRITSTRSVSPTITPIPTNLVKLDDDGATLQPEVLAIYPDGGQEIGAKGIIWVQFDQPMDQNTTSAAWTLSDESGSKIDGEITWSKADKLIFTPADSLYPGTSYQARIEMSAASTQDVELTEEISFMVNIANDLIVSQVFPADETNEVENNSVLTVIFNRPVVPLTIIEDQGDAPQPIEISPSISGHGEWLSTSVFIYHPDEPLLSSTRYTVRVIEGLRDTIGSELKADYEWQFSTAAPTIASFGVSAPVRTMNPENNLEDVRLESSFFINFNQSMEASSVEEEISIFSQLGEKVSVDFEWVSEKQVVISPTRVLTMGTDFTLLLNNSARSSTGGTLKDGLRWNFRSLPYPGVSTTNPENGAAQTRYSHRFGITFLSPMNLETMDGKVIFDPVLESDMNWHYNAWGWTANYYGLEPSTSYSVTILPGMEDIYGNKITKEYIFSFRTADRSPSAFLDLPYAPSIYTLGGDDRFGVSFVNVGTVDVNLYKLPVQYFVGFHNGTFNRWDFEPPDEWLKNFWHWEYTKDRNSLSSHWVHLTDVDGGLLDTGFYFLTINSPQISTPRPNLDTRLLIVAEANLTFKTTLSEGLMWINDLVSGEPIGDVPLTVYDDVFNKIGSGTTNSDGILHLELPIPEKLYRSRYVMSEEKGKFAFARSDWGSGLSPYEFGIWSSYYTMPDQPLAYVYTDRPLYRPGQKVSFKGVVRQNNDLAYSLLPWGSVEVEINSYNEQVFQQTMMLSEFGTFSGEFPIDNNGALGYYSILVRSPLDAESIGGVGFSVAEYRKPEFKVDTTVEPEDVLAGNEFNAGVNAEYFSGGGVSNAEVRWALQAVDYSFQPKGELSRYTFFDFDRDEDYHYSSLDSPRREIIANGIDQTDTEGHFDIALVADLSESGNSRQFIFETAVTDIAGTTVSDRVEIIAHKAGLYPGVRSQQYVGKVGKEQGFEIIVVDWDGEPVPNVLVDVQIVERRWYSVQEEDSQGYIQWKSTVEEIPVKSFVDLQVDSSGRSLVIFTPEKGGVYKAKVTARDEFGNEAHSGANIWISSTNYVSWRQTNDRKIELVNDKDLYQPGETAEILIASPLGGDNYALVTVERGQIRDYDVIRLTSNSVVFRLPITVDMAPNVYVSVIVIQGAEEAGKPDFRMGIIELNVASKEHEIQVEITSDKEQAGPGDTVTYYVRTTDHTGKPVRAEVSMALSDLATLSLTQPNSQAILDFFFNRQSLSVRTAVPIVLNIENYISSLEDRLSEGEGMGSGGGKGADEYGVYDIRGDFRDTAFWQASVVTDENGGASVTVTLPDNLTIWHMDARAVSLETLVGDSDLDIKSSKPLLLRPQTPRFFVVGDRSVVGTAVHNNSEEDLSVEVALDGSGLKVETAKVQRIDVPAGSQVYVSWEVRIASDTDRVDLIFMAKGGKYKDASRRFNIYGKGREV